MVIAPLLATAAFAVAPEAGLSPSDLVETVSISGVSISPDGRTVAFRTEQPSIGDNRIRLSWQVVPVDGSLPARPVADGGGAAFNYGALVSQTPIWAPSSKAFYVTAAIDGEVQAWRASLDGGAPIRVTSEAADIRSLAISADGRALRYDVGPSRDEVARAERAEETEGVLIDSSVDVPAALMHNAMMNGRATTLRFGPKWLAREPLLWNSHVESRRLAFRADDLMATTRPDQRRSFIVTRIEKVGDAQRLHATAADGLDHICSAPACVRDHVQAAAPLTNGEEVLVTTRDAAMAYTLSIWRPRTGRWRVLARSPGELDDGAAIDPQSCAIAQQQAVCVAAEPSGPPRLVSIDLASGRRKTLFDPNAALRRRTWPVRLVQWKTPSGMPVTGQLFLPRGPIPAGGFPLVLDYYNCRGFLKGGVGDELPLAPLAEAGIAALCINEAPGPRTSERLLDDRGIEAVTAVIDQLSSQGTVDRKRVGMAGLSFGSTVMLAVAERTRLLRAAAMSSGQIEPAYYWLFGLRGDAMRGSLQSFFGVGDPNSDKAGWSLNAPVAHVEAIRAPLLIQIPESEMRVTMEFYSRLRASGTPTEMFAFPGEMHIKTEPRHKLAVYQRNLDWFRYWLLGKEDPDPAKAGQYARWRGYSDRPGFALPIQDHPAP